MIRSFTYLNFSIKKLIYHYSSSRDSTSRCMQSSDPFPSSRLCEVVDLLDACKPQLRVIAWDISP